MHDQRWSFHDNGSIGNKVTTWTLMATNHASIYFVSYNYSKKEKRFDWWNFRGFQDLLLHTNDLSRETVGKMSNALHYGPRWRFFFLLVFLFFFFFFKSWLDFVAEKTWEWNFEIMIWFGFFALKVTLKCYMLNCLEDILENVKVMLDFRNYYNLFEFLW